MARATSSTSAIIPGAAARSTGGAPATSRTLSRAASTRARSRVAAERMRAALQPSLERCGELTSRASQPTTRSSA